MMTRLNLLITRARIIWSSFPILEKIAALTLGITFVSIPLAVISVKLATNNYPKATIVGDENAQITFSPTSQIDFTLPYTGDPLYITLDLTISGQATPAANPVVYTYTIDNPDVVVVAPALNLSPSAFSIAPLNSGSATITFTATNPETGDIYTQAPFFVTATTPTSSNSPSPTPTASAGASPSPTPPLCFSADINHDGTVDSADRDIMISDFFTSNQRSDLNGDNIVDITDYSLLVKAYHQTSTCP